jgi:protein-tyrosine-phosphatase
MNPLRTWLKGALPPLAQDAFRDLRVLPRGARRQWWRAAWHHWRQAPGELLPAQLSLPLEIVALCYGNIYRSPFAAALLEREVARRGWQGVHVSSAGFVRREGRASPENACTIAREFDISLEAHASSCLTRERAESAALLLVMDRQHEALLLREHPHVLPKVVPLWRFGTAPGAREEVLHDPYGHGIDTVRTCYQRIARGVESLADALVTRGIGV